MENPFRIPEAFVFDGSNVAQRWVKWRKQFETYFVAAEISSKTPEVQVAILLHAAGCEAQEIHGQFTFASEDDKKDYKKILDLFDTYCKPRKNTVYERYRFWSRDQMDDEPVDKWVKDLKTISANCEFEGQESNMIRDKIVFGYREVKVKERMLRESKLDLTKALEICRAAESTKDQMKEMSNQRSVEDSAVHNVSTRQSLPNRRNNNHNKQYEKGDGNDDDGASYKPDVCFNCGGVGHYSRDCPSGDSYPRGRRKSRGRGRGRSSRGRGGGSQQRRFHEIDEEVPDAEFQSLSLSSITVDAVNTSKTAITKRHVTFKFHKGKGEPASEAELKVDSGSAANLMPVSHYQKLYPNKLDRNRVPADKHIEKSEAILTAYGGTVIKHFGKVKLPCEYKEKKFMCSFYLSNIEGPILLGLPTSEALGIIKINVDQVRVNKYIPPDMPIEDRPPINTKEELRMMYPECFKDGPENHFPGYSYHVGVEGDSKPKIHATRRVPLELQDPVKVELERMVKRGAITKVDTPTEWVSSMVISTRSDGRVRICLDPSDLNKVIQREHYVSAIIQDKAHLLNGSDTFTKLDAKDGYWHVRLDEESSYLTTFNTPFGRYRFLVMPPGLSVAQDIFQMKIDETYDECEGVIGVADDINVHSKGDRQHDLRLHNCMEKTRRANIALNYDKVFLKQPRIKFFGNLYSKDGVQADPDKVAAIQDLRHPESKSELKTFLGMLNYLQQFIPKLSENSAPLRELEKKSNMFHWDDNLQKCFESLKTMVANDITLAYYDRSKPVTLQTDYSRAGIGAALVQDGRPVHYGSKALVGAEANYSTIEGEMLAIVYGTKKWHHYLYGRKFIVESDHKPLVSIHKKNIALAPPRIRGMLMAMSPYDYEIRYKPGKEMVLPDTLSRLSGADKTEIPGLQVKIHSLVTVSDSRLKQLIADTAEDDVLQRLMQVFEAGWPSSIKGLHKDIRPFWSIRDDISVLSDLVLCGSRIIVPVASRKRTLENIHEGHQGEMKCKLRAKTAVYWPGMYGEIENMVKCCPTCQEYENAQPKCPMLPMDVPPHAWHTIGADLFHFKGKWYILLTDYFSKMPFVRYVGGTSAAASIRAMKSVFSENGIPLQVISDNGSHFSAREFRTFANTWGFNLTLSSPEYPRGHGLIERHIQTIKKCMRKCDHSGYDLDLALLSLRSTPLDSHIPSAAELLNNRKYRTTVPSISLTKTQEANTREQLESKQAVSKSYYDQHVRSKADLLPNQAVRVYDKDSRRWKPATVTGVASTPRSYIVQRAAGGIPLRRNRQHIKPTRERWDKYASYMDPLDDFDMYTEEDSVLQPVSTNAGNSTPRSSETAQPQSNTDNEAPVLSVPRSSRYPTRVRRQTDFYKAS